MKKNAVIAHKTVFWIISFLLTWCMYIQTMILHQRTLRIMYDVLSLTNSTLLTAYTILFCTNNPVPNWWLFFFFPR